MSDRISKMRSFIEDIYPDLDLYNYYQLLQVDPHAPPDVVRSAFYQQAARMHPDRFAGADPKLRNMLVTIYARIAEAYRVLSDPKKRPAYDATLGQGQVRYAEVEREKKGPQNPEDAVDRPEAKKFYRLALQAQQTGDLKGAHMNLKFALSYQPDSEFLRRQLAEVEGELKGKAAASRDGGAAK